MINQTRVFDAQIFAVSAIFTGKKKRKFFCRQKLQYYIYLGMYGFLEDTLEEFLLHVIPRVQSIYQFWMRISSELVMVLH